MSPRPALLRYTGKRELGVADNERLQSSPPGTDINPADNSASDSDPVGQFADF